MERCGTDTVAGAASGFGKAITNRFIEEGAKVVAVDMNEEGLAKTFADTAQSHVATLTANVTVANDWSKMVETCQEKFGGVDILINNAGTVHQVKFFSAAKKWG